MIHRIYVPIAAVALALGVAGCSNSSDNAPTTMPPERMQLALPDGHGLVAATIEAGGRQDGKRGVVIECPAGGNACVVEFAEDGSATYAATGGTPTVAINRMILAANNGPLGGSDGDHAEGLFLGVDAILGVEEILSAFQRLAPRSNPMPDGTMPDGTGIVQSTLGTGVEAAVVASAPRSGAAAPTLGLALGREAFGNLNQLSPVDLDRRSDSTIPALDDGWNGAAFERDIPGGTTVHAVVYSDVEPAPDAEYLTLGVWLSLPDSPAGRYDAGVFAEGQTPFDETALTGLTGMANWDGPATGIYATGVYSSDSLRGVTSPQVGAFVAKATLRAEFGQVFEVSGAIRDFEENGRSLGDWEVFLRQTAIDASSLTAGLTAGEADGRLLGGRWGVRFFRDGNEQAPNNPRNHPGYAAGTFIASTVDIVQQSRLGIRERSQEALHLIGAFGAQRRTGSQAP